MAPLGHEDAARKAGVVILYHFTSHQKWRSIESAGRIKLTLPDLVPESPHFATQTATVQLANRTGVPFVDLLEHYPDLFPGLQLVVFCTTDPRPERLGGALPHYFPDFIREVRMTLEVPRDALIPYGAWLRSSDPARSYWKKQWKSWGAEDWYLVTRPIPTQEWSRVEATETGLVLWGDSPERPAGRRLSEVIPDPIALVAAVTADSTSARSPVHGVSHWRAVARAGLELCQRVPQADPAVVFPFALLHDSKRLSDGEDPEHGDRGADLAEKLSRTGLFDLRPEGLKTLLLACALHSRGVTTTEPTIAVAWDADRLDLWRVGIKPEGSLLSTGAAKARIGPAMQPPTWDESWATYFEPAKALAGDYGR